MTRGSFFGLARSLSPQAAVDKHLGRGSTDSLTLKKAFPDGHCDANDSLPLLVSDLPCLG